MSQAYEASLRAVKTVITCEECGVSYKAGGCYSLTDLKRLLMVSGWRFGKYIKCPNCRLRAKKEVQK